MCTDPIKMSEIFLKSKFSINNILSLNWVNFILLKLNNYDKTSEKGGRGFSLFW